MIRAIITIAIYSLVECAYLVIAQYVLGDLSAIPGSERVGLVMCNLLWLAVTTFIMEIENLRKSWVDLILGERP